MLGSHPLQRPVALPSPGMLGVVTDERTVDLRHVADGLRRWRRFAIWGQQLELFLFHGLSKKLRADRAGDDLRYQGWHGIAEHALDVIAAAVEFEAIGEGLQPTQLKCRQASAGPVERPRCRSWLR